MSQTHKRVKLLTQYFEDAGLKLDTFVNKKDGRVSAFALAHNGQRRMFSLSNGSTSDNRGDLNERSAIRRWANEMGMPTQLEEKIKEKLPELKRVIALEPKTVEEAAIMDAMDKLPREIEVMPEPEPEAPMPVTRKIAILSQPRRRKTVDDTPPAKPAKKTRALTSKLTLHEQYVVIEWLKTFDVAQFDQPSMLATHINDVQKLIPVPVSAKFVSDAVKMLGKKFRDRRRQDGDELGTFRKDRCQMVARELRRMADSLGFELSAEFHEYLRQRSGKPPEAAGAEE